MLLGFDVTFVACSNVLLAPPIKHFYALFT
jgi:hypothetical protein